jgi:uncharacterized protein DUF222/HNH endonuclease
MSYSATASDTVGIEVQALGEVVERLVGLDPHDMADAELSESLVELSRLRSRIEAVEARLTTTWDARKVWLDDDARSGAAWLAERCRIPLQAGRARVRFARRLRFMTPTREALLAGEIDMAHGHRLGRAWARSRAVFPRDERLLLGHAQSLRYGAFDRVMSYWEQLADPDGTEDDAAAHAAGRSLHLSQTYAGRWVLDGSADAVRGTIVADALTRIEDELFEADWAKAKARLGDAVTVSALARTPAQRRFDALVEMARRAMTTPRDGRAPRPLFTALIDYPATLGRICQLASGTVVTPGELAAWFDGADLERMVFNGASRVLDVGIRQRVFTGATRRAVEARDLFCTGFACEEPPDRCDVDHVQPYAQGGPTVQDNGRLACPVHNPGRRRKRRRPGPDPPI